MRFKDLSLLTVDLRAVLIRLSPLNDLTKLLVKCKECNKSIDIGEKVKACPHWTKIQ